VRLYLDEDLNPLIVGLLRDRGIDAVSAHERNARRVPDSGQLDLAAREDRCLDRKSRRLHSNHSRAAGVSRASRRGPDRHPSTIAAVTRLGRGGGRSFHPRVPCRLSADAVAFIGLTAG
jgi:hypothetical protein